MSADLIEETDSEPNGIICGNAVEFIPQMEKDWLQFERTNRLNEPPAQLLRERWFRQKFRLFANKWLTDRWVIPPKPLGSEDYIFALYPDMIPEWDKKRSFLENIVPSDTTLIESWMRARKIHFQNRWLKANISHQKENTNEDKKVDKEIASFCHLRKNFRYCLFYINNFAVIEFLVFLSGVFVFKYHI